MRALAEALRFLSIIPVPGRPPARNSAVIAAYPWAGLLIGAVVAGTAWAAGRLFGVWSLAVVITATRIIVTGGLHMDGLADLADGLGGGRNPERCLAIMADSRLGSFGALALLVTAGLQTATAAEILTGAPLPGRLNLDRLCLFAVVPALSRGVVPLLMRIFSPARPGGMGNRNQKTATPAAAAFAGFSAVILTAAGLGVNGLIVAAWTAATMILIGFFIARRLGGLTGDCYGALIEIGEVLAFLGIIITSRFCPDLPGLRGGLR